MKPVPGPVAPVRRPQELVRGSPSCLPTPGVGSANLWSGRSRLTRIQSTRTGCPHLLRITEKEVVGAPQINIELARVVFDPDEPNIKFLRTCTTSACEKCINVRDKELEYPHHEFHRTSNILHLAGAEWMSKFRGDVSKVKKCQLGRRRKWKKAGLVADKLPKTSKTRSPAQKNKRSLCKEARRKRQESMKKRSLEFAEKAKKELKELLSAGRNNEHPVTKTKTKDHDSEYSRSTKNEVDTVKKGNPHPKKSPSLEKYEPFKMKAEAKDNHKMSKVCRGGWGPFVPLVGGAPPDKQGATGIYMTRDGIKSEDTDDQLVSPETGLQEVEDEPDEIEKALMDEICRMKEMQDSKWKILELIQLMQTNVDSKMQEVHERMTKNIDKGKSGIEKFESTSLNEIWRKHQVIDSETQCFWKIEQIKEWQLSLERMLLENTSKIQNKYSELEKMGRKHVDEIKYMQRVQQCKIQEMEDKHCKYQMKRRKGEYEYEYSDPVRSRPDPDQESMELRCVNEAHMVKAHMVKDVVRDAVKKVDYKPTDESMMCLNEAASEVKERVRRPLERPEIYEMVCRNEADMVKESLKKPNIIDDLEQEKMVNTLISHTCKLQESQEIKRRMSEEMENLRDRMYLSILDMKIKLRMLESRHNTLDMTKWQSALEEIKIEFLKGMQKRKNVNSEVLQDTKNTKDRIESNILMMKLKLSKRSRVCNFEKMNMWNKTLDEGKKKLFDLLQRRKENKIKLFDMIPNMQEKVILMMEEMKLDMKSQMQKMLALDMNSVHQAKLDGICPLDMDTEKWKLGLEGLEKELLEDIRVNQLKILHEVKTAQHLLAAGLWQEAWQWKPTIETMKRLHLSEKNKVGKKYSELELLEKSQRKEMQKILQKAEKENVHDDQMETDSEREETEKCFLTEICKMQERRGQIEESFDFLRKTFEPVDLKMKEIQERIHSRRTKKVHKNPSVVESREKALLFDVWMAQEDMKSQIQKCLEVKEAQNLLSALENMNFEKIQEMYSGQSDLKIRSNQIVDVIKHLETKLDLDIEEMQTSSKSDSLHLHWLDPICIYNIESEAKEMDIMIKSYLEKKVASDELHAIISDLKNIEVEKNHNISKLQPSLEQMQLIALQWEEKWQVLQSKYQESTQEVDDWDEEMGDLEKALSDETDRMHERKELKTELLSLLQEKQDITALNKHKITEIIESEMVKMWRTQEIQEMQSVIENMQWDTPQIHERWTAVKVCEEIGITEFEDSVETLIGTLNEELSNESQKVQENQSRLDDKVNIKEFNITKPTENTSEILLTTINMNLSDEIKNFNENQRKKPEYNNINTFKIAKDSLAEIKTKWTGVESSFQDMQNKIWPELFNTKCKSALKRLKIVHSKEKQRMRSTMEIIESVPMEEMQTLQNIWNSDPEEICVEVELEENQPLLYIEKVPMKEIQPLQKILNFYPEEICVEVEVEENQPLLCIEKVQLEEIQTLQKILNSDQEQICEEVEVEEKTTLLLRGATALSRTEKVNQTKRVQMKPERKKECVTADYVEDEFKQAFKTCCGYPKLATMKTTLITLFLGVLPSLIDLFSDVILGIACIMEEDYMWGGVTLVIPLLPGLHWAGYRKALTGGEKRWRCSYVLSCIFYPFFMVTFKLGMLVNQGNTTKWMASLVKTSEVNFEALPQLILQSLKIIWSGKCSWQQGLSIGSSLATASLGLTERFLTTRQIGLKEDWYHTMDFGKTKLTLIGGHLPFYLFLTIFRVLSLVFTIFLLGLLSLPLYASLLLLLVVTGALRASSVYEENLGSYLKKENVGLVTLALGSIVTTTSDEKQPEEQFQLFWLGTNLILAGVLGTLVLLEPTYLPMLIPDHFLHQNLPVALVLATILFTGLTSFAMFYASIKQGLECTMDKAPIKEQKKKNEPRKKTKCICCCCICIRCCRCCCYITTEEQEDVLGMEVVKHTDQAEQDLERGAEADNPVHRSNSV